MLEIVLSVGTNAPTTATTQLNCQVPSGEALASFADVNNDKKLDVVYSCSGYIVIQLGNGDGTFQAPAYFAVNAQQPVLVDLNGDGFLDIAALVPGNTAPQVAVLLNKGTANPGMFQSPALYAAPSGPTGLFTGDFNGDGKPDLITAIVSFDAGYPTSTSLSIFYGKGDGTLNAAATLSTSNSSSFTIGARLQRMPNCSRTWEVATADFKPWEPAFPWESPMRALGLPVILTPTES